jgi:small GTP-binding protein
MKYKIVILGDGGTGKSCLTIQFCYQFFVPDYDPTVENLYQKRMNCDGHLLVLEILDTAGQEQYVRRLESEQSPQTQRSLKHSLVIIVCFARSIHSHGRWLSCCLQYYSTPKF